MFIKHISGHHMKLDTVPGGLQEMEVREWAIKSEEWQERGGEGLTSPRPLD